MKLAENTALSRNRGTVFFSEQAKQYLACLLCLLLVFTVLPLQSRSQNQSSLSNAPRKLKIGKIEGEYVPGEILVRYRNEDAANLEEGIEQPLALDGRVIDIDVQRFEGSDLIEGLRFARVAPEQTLETIEALNARSDVLYAEPNYIWHADAVPNDPRFPEQYALQRISAPAAWDITQGDQNVVVGVIDSGIDINHSDLKDNIWRNPGEIPDDNIDNDNNGYVDDVYGWDFANGDKTVFDSASQDAHGTHVAGTIGARGNNAIGVTGVNWRVSIMSLKVIGAGGASTSKIIEGYNYARMMKERGINLRVLNNSYGGGGKSQAALDAITQLNQAGILFVASAGNDSTDNFNFPRYPSGYNVPNVLGVASTTSSEQLSSFSNFGARIVSMGAPGSSILSTTPNNSYSSFSGTSMSAPHVSGAAALVLAANPNLTVQQLRGVLGFSGDILPVLVEKTTTGRRLNVHASINSSREQNGGVDTIAPSVPESFAISSQNGRDVTLTWIAPGDDGASGTASDYDVFFTGTQPNVIPLLLPTQLIPSPAGTAQNVTVTIPYRNFSGTITLRTYDNAGNSSEVSLPVTLSVNPGSDPYIVTLSEPGALSTGGTSLNLTGDDKFIENYQLPFAFPFFGKTRATINISTNGALYFSRIPRSSDDPTNGLDAGSSIEGLAGQEIIAGMWDDLRTDRPVGGNGGVFVVQPNADTIIFRWQGTTFNTPLTGNTQRGEQPINFEIELRRDGTIIMRYGAGQSSPINTRLFPVVGISGGEPDAYLVESHTSETFLKNLTNAQTVTFSPRTTSPRPPMFDYDGDGKTDLSIFRLSNGQWWLHRSSDNASRVFQFGASDDRIIPADYTGDGKTDVAFFRPSTNEWFILRSEDATFYSFPFGTAGDIPAPADFDGDGKADPAVFRPSNATWYILKSTGGTLFQQFGADGDIPVAADYDGDNKADLAVYRPSNGTWWIQRSASNAIVYQFGGSADKPVPADYTGDGKADIAVFRPTTNEWFVLRSEDSSFYSAPFGASGDIPVPGDYDGDGRVDFAVFRPSEGNWYLLRSQSGFTALQFGLSSDKPTPSAFVP